MTIAEVQNEAGFWFPPEKPSFSLSGPYLFCHSHPAQTSQTNILFQLEKQVKNGSNRKDSDLGGDSEMGGQISC